jgi:uncharacterized protein YbaP (TraB family)
MRLILALLALLFPALASAKTAEAKPALWKLSDSDTTIWLFGSVHVLPPGIVWFRGPVAKAFAKSDTLVVETELGGPAEGKASDAKAIMAHAVDTDGVPLRDELTPAKKAAFERRMTGYGLPAGAFDPFKPWFAATSLTSIAYGKLGYDPNSGVEMTLFAEARRAHKPVVPLESMESQISLLDSFARPTQLRMLETTLDELADDDGHIATLMTAWRTGDEAALAKEMNDGLDDVPELRTVLLDKRNEHFADWIAGRMAQPGIVFLAVGAGHFGGKHNVRELLEAKGFRIKRVQ